MSVAEGPARRHKHRPSPKGPLKGRIYSVKPFLKRSPEKDGNLGPDAARARNRHSCPAARCAGCGGIGKTLESPNRKVPALHREAEHDTTGNFSRQPPLHTWIGRRVQETVAAEQHSAIFDEDPPNDRRKDIKVPLTLSFYCGIRAARRQEFVGEPCKYWCFAGMRAFVRRGIAMARRHLDRRGAWPNGRPNRSLE